MKMAGYNYGESFLNSSQHAQQSPKLNAPFSYEDIAKELSLDNALSSSVNMSRLNSLKKVYLDYVSVVHPQWVEQVALHKERLRIAGEQTSLLSELASIRSAVSTDTEALATGVTTPTHPAFSSHTGHSAVLGHSYASNPPVTPNYGKAATTTEARTPSASKGVLSIPKLSLTPVAALGSTPLAAEKSSLPSQQPACVSTQSSKSTATHAKHRINVDSTSQHVHLPTNGLTYQDLKLSQNLSLTISGGGDDGVSQLLDDVQVAQLPKESPTNTISPDMTPTSDISFTKTVSKVEENEEIEGSLQYSEEDELGFDEKEGHLGKDGKAPCTELRDRAPAQPVHDLEIRAMLSSSADLSVEDDSDLGEGPSLTSPPYQQDDTGVPELTILDICTPLKSCTSSPPALTIPQQQAQLQALSYSSSKENSPLPRDGDPSQGIKSDKEEEDKGHVEEGQSAFLTTLQEDEGNNKSVDSIQLVLSKDAEDSSESFWDSDNQDDRHSSTSLALAQQTDVVHSGGTHKETKSGESTPDSEAVSANQYPTVPAATLQGSLQSTATATALGSVESVQPQRAASPDKPKSDPKSLTTLKGPSLGGSLAASLLREVDELSNSQSSESSKRSLNVSVGVGAEDGVDLASSAVYQKLVSSFRSEGGHSARGLDREGENESLQSSLSSESSAVKVIDQEMPKGRITPGDSHQPASQQHAAQSTQGMGPQELDLSSSTERSEAVNPPDHLPSLLSKDSSARTKSADGNDPVDKSLSCGASLRKKKSFWSDSDSEADVDLLAVSPRSGGVVEGGGRRDNEDDDFDFYD